MNLIKNWRILFWVTVVVLSILLVGTKGLSFGIDFTGGTELKMVVESGGEEHITAVVDILKNRLNGMGLKSTQVLKEADGRHITIKVSTTDHEELANVKNVINQQAMFEQYVEGQLCSKGEEIQLDLSKQGGAFISGRSWQVYVKNGGDAPTRCGQVMDGKAGHMTDIFLDRPARGFILMESSDCQELSNIEFKNHPSDMGYTQLSFLEDRANIPVVCYTTIEKEPEPEVNQSLLDDFGVTIANETETMVLDLSESTAELQKLFESGKDRIILTVALAELPSELQDKISELNLTVRMYVKSEDQPFHINYPTQGGRPDNSESWIDVVTGLKSTLEIGEGLTYGNAIFNSVFEGGSSTPEEARATAERFKIWLTSGNLPVKTTIILERPNLPELGQQFLKYAGIIALIALLLVASIIYVRYRAPKISMSILITAFSEIVMILGFASLMSWELDLAAIAGIIGAIGTGVDHQIIITDEAMRGERKKKDEGTVWDVKQSINRAFFIILASAVTTICAMLPLMSIIDLRGFAFTSIIGICIGLFISRPAYGRIVELIT